MNSSVYRCSRVEKTNNVDITAHLSSIRDLETKMAEYHRCDRVPAWAESLINRVELLESAISKGHCDPGTATLPLRSVATTSNLSIPEKATIFDHMLDRQRTHFNSQIISSRLFLDSQIEMITFELERLHNLMTIRPTTADLQLLASSLHDVHRRMYDSFDDIAAGIG